MKKVKVIVNADDFGLTLGCNKGIIKGINEGIITSTTVMVNMPYAFRGIRELEAINFKSIGVHLTLTCGKPTLPVDKVPSLVDDSGNFYRRRAQLFPKMNLKEVELELHNQIKLFMSSGLKPSHLDSHHHIHMYDGLREVVCKLAKMYDLPLRYANEETKEYLKENKILTTDGFTMEFYDDMATIDTIKKNLTGFDGNTIEFMVHPAYVDEELLSLSSYNTNREKELEILTSKSIIKWLKENNFELIGYHQLKE